MRKRPLGTLSSGPTRPGGPRPTQGDVAAKIVSQGNLDGAPKVRGGGERDSRHGCGGAESAAEARNSGLRFGRICPASVQERQSEPPKRAKTERPVLRIWLGLRR